MEIVWTALALMHFFCFVLSTETSIKYEVAWGLAGSYGSAIARLKARSMLECLRNCASTELCQSVTYDPTKGACVTNADCVDLESVSCSEVDCSSHAQVKYATKQLIGQRCTQLSDCHVYNSECRQYQCFCKPGFSFSILHNTCMSECEMFGATFQPDKSKALVYNYTDIRSDVHKKSACKILCLNELSYTCRAYQHSVSSKLCVLHNFTALERPDVYAYSHHYDLFTRDCQ